MHGKLARLASHLLEHLAVKLDCEKYIEAQTYHSAQTTAKDVQSHALPPPPPILCALAPLHFSTTKIKLYPRSAVVTDRTIGLGENGYIAIHLVWSHLYPVANEHAPADVLMTQLTTHLSVGTQQRAHTYSDAKAVKSSRWNTSHWLQPVPVSLIALADLSAMPALPDG